MGPVSHEPERILWNSTAPTADGTGTDEAHFVARFVWARLVEDLWRDNLYILPKQTVDDHVDHQPHNKGIDEEETMPENNSSIPSGYNRSTHDDVVVWIVNA